MLIHPLVCIALFVCSEIVWSCVVTSWFKYLVALHGRVLIAWHWSVLSHGLYMTNCYDWCMLEIYILTSGSCINMKRWLVHWMYCLLFITPNSVCWYQLYYLKHVYLLVFYCHYSSFCRHYLILLAKEIWTYYMRMIF